MKNQAKNHAHDRPRLAVVSASAALDNDSDLAPLRSALDAAGWKHEVVTWDDERIEWADFDVILIRSTWDYVERIDEFRAWIDRVAPLGTLRNRPEAVRWSLDKHYLAELAAAGLPVTPTVFIDEIDDLEQGLARVAEAPSSSGAVVVKPTISAGSRETLRHDRREVGAIRTHVQRILAEGSAAMIQPYFEGVDQAGETAMIFLGGQFSHAIRKGPILTSERVEVAGLYAQEQIDRRQPTPAEVHVASTINRWLTDRFGPLTYARIDLLPSAAGPVLLEVELVEPSLFLDLSGQTGAADAAARLVAVLESELAAQQS